MTNFVTYTFWTTQRCMNLSIFSRGRSFWLYHFSWLNMSICLWTVIICFTYCSHQVSFSSSWGLTISHSVFKHFSVLVTMLPSLLAIIFCNSNAHKKTLLHPLPCFPVVLLCPLFHLYSLPLPPPSLPHLLCNINPICSLWLWTLAMLAIRHY